MSSRVVIRAGNLRRCLQDINPLFPKGTDTVPLLFSFSDDKLVIVCTTGCTYKTTIPVVSSESSTWEMTVLYKSLLDFVPNSGTLALEAFSYGLSITGTEFEVQLPTSYSVVTNVEVPNARLVPVDNTTYVGGLRRLLGMRLGELYMQDRPVSVYDSVAVLKYPNIEVQVRANGLHLSAVIAPEHLMLLAQFQPTALSCDNNTLLLQRDTSYLMVPVKGIQEANTFTELLKDMSSPVTLDTDKYVDRIRSMVKLSNKARCKVVFHDNGISSSVSYENVTIKALLGDTSSSVNKVGYVPITLWLKMIAALGGTEAQFMYGGDTICLRNQSIIIVVRALS